MDISDASTTFAALGQPTRLAVLRLLVQAGPEGMPAGRIADTLDVRQNTLSANLNILSQAGLIRGTRTGRQIVYSADMDGLRTLLAFLLQDCCGGRADLCQPILDDIACAC
ncbi:metalloregulator ArsR/SmtB family transcription factor [Paracoccus sp. TK19116]|uniref:Metalloregulator ArsR/SmtB family transcription factor n=1 Tax=Paracoccus albicereus TaxID=2922394 RepID=A0ABT1MPE5_9RHOB|nr:metalloregulator ArsR/SmtB family transcription factor [Paracoccus albicereus]MCQ0969984.1 metalloregulator ArsR/SmtB family transcription factor [Paracoccus albicereus]